MLLFISFESAPAFLLIDLLLLVLMRTSPAAEIMGITYRYFRIFAFWFFHHDNEPLCIGCPAAVTKVIKAGRIIIPNYKGK